VTTQEERQQLSDGLHALAEAVLNPKFPNLGEVRVRVNADVWGHVNAEGEEVMKYESAFPYKIMPAASLSRLRAQVRGMGGRKEKRYTDSGFTCTRDFSERVSVTVSASRETVCHKVPTGNKIIHASRTEYIPERIEEEYEWVCDEMILTPHKEKA
jgi:hypothetical protein